MKAKIEELIRGRGGSPFLFIGSGFSRRYLGLEDWDGLLRKFADGVRDFDYFLASANGSYPVAAGLLADQFHDLWWKDERFANSREKFKDQTKSRDGALKNEISLYLSELELAAPDNEGLSAELEMLRHANVDGIITTNWDLLIEEIFPEYKVYVGQEELLFSNPQSIAEIYKIHGSCQNPTSLVLTQGDYDEFEKRNPYLAAKLITIFIEHPIIFIGYSINDRHISNIIFSIASCLGEDKIETFAQNLVFLQRASGKEPSIQGHTFSRDGKNVSATIIETDDFRDVFSILAEHRRKIPARILRYCKEQMFELVRSSEPEEKIAVIDIDELDEKESVEFVVGVGVASSAKDIAAHHEPEGYADSGYQGLDRQALFKDVVSEQSQLDGEKVLRFVIPKIRKTGTTFMPLFRYLKMAGIDSEAKLLGSEFEDAKIIYQRLKGKSYKYGSTYSAAFDKNWKDKSAKEIVSEAGLDRATIFLAYMKREDIESEWLRQFLVENLEREFSDPYSTAFAKLICLYDRWQYGFPTEDQTEIVEVLMG